MEFSLGSGKVLITEMSDPETGLPKLTLSKVAEEHEVGLEIEEIDLPILEEVTINIGSRESGDVLFVLLKRALSRFGEYTL